MIFLPLPLLYAHGVKSTVEKGGIVVTAQANQHRGVAAESSPSRYERALMGISIIFELV